MREMKKILLHKRVIGVKYKHLLIEDVLFPCFWHWSAIAAGQTLKQAQGRTTAASDESFR